MCIDGGVQTILRIHPLLNASRISHLQVRQLQARPKGIALIVAALACIHIVPLAAADDTKTDAADTQQQVADISEKLQLSSNQSMQLRTLMSNLND